MILTISTWGEGEPPDDGVNFFDYVRNLALSSLANMRFAIFALETQATINSLPMWQGSRP